MRNNVIIVFKRALAQELMLRGNKDFGSAGENQEWGKDCWR